MEARFYRRDSYLQIRRKFTGAWANLRLEMHYQSEKFWKVGGDEFEDDEQFFSSEAADGLLFTLTGGTTKAVARRLFADYYSNQGLNGNYIEAFIYGNFPDEIAYSTENATLDEANNPFILPLNRFVYAEFKRRFAEHWTNLSIEIYQGEMQNGDLPPEATELADDFEMKNLTGVNRLVSNEFFEREGVRYGVQKLANEAVLRDDIYLSSLANELERSNIFFKIRNNKLGIYWGRNSKYPQLKKFQTGEI